MADLYKADGRSQRIKPDNGAAFTMEELSKHVGGYVEIVGTRYNDDNKRLYVIGNEDGIPMRLPTNKKASELARKLLVGDILFIDEAEAAILLDEGDDEYEDESEDNYDAT